MTETNYGAPHMYSICILTTAYGFFFFKNPVSGRVSFSPQVKRYELALKS